MDVHGMRCLIAGGARGLGAALALDLARRGADLVVSYRTSADQAERTCADVRGLGRRCAALRVDLTDADDARRLVARAADELGGLDALVYVASGPFVPHRPDELDEAAWSASLDTIAKGFFFAAQAAHRAFGAGAAHGVLVDDYSGEPAGPSVNGTARSGGGTARSGDETAPLGDQQTTAAADRPGGAAAPGAGAVSNASRGVIVAITDVAGEAPWAAFAAHSAAKAAQVALVKALAKAWGPDGVRVCGVAPGPLDTPDDKRRSANERAAARTVVGRLERPEEIAAAVRFCIENDYVTGQNLIVDGGYLLK